MDATVEALLRDTQSALVVIDEQKRHLDPVIAYHPVPREDGERVLRETSRVLAAARAATVPVVHVRTQVRVPYQGEHIDNKNPFWRRQVEIPGSGVRRQATRSEEGSPYAEIMPEVAPLVGEPIVTKSRYSAFYGTDLEVVLRGLGVASLVLAGVNTNNCVLGTAFDAHARDFAVLVVGDACGSMNGSDFHAWGLRQIDAALGWIISADEYIAAMERR